MTSPLSGTRRHVGAGTPNGEGGPVPPKLRGSEGGFTLVELLVSMAVLLIVSGIVVNGTMDMTFLGQKMTNRSDMHSSVRNATALLQQEVGQAGRITLPGTVTLAGATGIGVFTVNVNSTDGMFVGEQLTIDIGTNEETVTLSAVDFDADSITANFMVAHPPGTRVAVDGGFWAGVIPTTMANGSTGTVLKIVGDINGDGRLVYVEYTCDMANGLLYRNVMDYDTVGKPPINVEQILLSNLLPNPPNPNGNVPPCFTYQERTFAGRTYVIGVAIMTTVRSEVRDRNTNDFQRVTKALLNVAPRNVINVWQLASLYYMNRVQPLPPSVVQLLPTSAVQQLP
jgi:prepilin-type N-terminal cleavage/methylation domain-containing protein